MYDFDFDKGRKKEKKEKFSDSKPRHFPRKWPRQKELGEETKHRIELGKKGEGK